MCLDIEKLTMSETDFFLNDVFIERIWRSFISFVVFRFDFEFRYDSS